MHYITYTTNTKLAKSTALDDPVIILANLW